MSSLSATEQRLVGNASDEVAWAHYARELQAAGDARGAVIERELAGIVGVSSDAREFIERDAAEWLNLPSYDRNDEDPGLWFEWKHGFVLSVIVDLRPGLLKWPTLLERFERFLDARAARLLRRIEVRRVENGTEDEYLAKIVQAPRPALRDVSLTAGDASPLSRWAGSELERLVLRNVQTLKPSMLPKLRQLAIESMQLSVKAMGDLAKCHLPELTTLRLAIGGSDTKSKQCPGAADIAAVITAFPRLQSFEIGNVSFGDELVELIVGGAASANLESLDVSGAKLSAKGVHALRDGAARLPSLKMLSVNAGVLGRVPIETFGALADKLSTPSPTTARVARHAIAMAAECLAAESSRRGTDVAAAVRTRRWANLWLFEECSDIGDSACVASLGVLAWALKLVQEPGGTALAEPLLSAIPIERSFDGFIASASLRSREEIATALARHEEMLWNDWRGFKDVSALREQIRALRWLLGVATRWADVPRHLTRHALAPPAVASPALVTRIENAWKMLSKAYGRPLPGPLSEDEVDAAEREIGHRLPPDLRASYVLHGAESYPAIQLLSLERALEAWRNLDRWTVRGDEPVWANEPIHRQPLLSRDDSLDAVRDGSWRRAWFPLTSEVYGSDFYGADLDPAPGGAVGQVFFWAHEIPGPECVMSPSFVEWLEWAESTEQFAPMDDD